MAATVVAVLSELENIFSLRPNPISHFYRYPLAFDTESEKVLVEVADCPVLNLAGRMFVQSKFCLL